MSIFALINLPVDLTFTNNSFLKSSLLLVIIFKSFKFTLVFIRCSFLPTMISFLSAIIFITYNGFLSEIPIPLR